MSGSLVIVGLGPGSVDLLTPSAARALGAATDLVGYGPYLDRIPQIAPGQRRHASDNRVEIERARHALTLAAEGRKVAVGSGGDPGVFAMAAAVLTAAPSSVTAAPKGAAARTARPAASAACGHSTQQIRTTPARARNHPPGTVNRLSDRWRAFSATDPIDSRSSRCIRPLRFHASCASAPPGRRRRPSVAGRFRR